MRTIFNLILLAGLLAIVVGYFVFLIILALTFLGALPKTLESLTGRELVVLIIGAGVLYQLVTALSVRVRKTVE